MAVHKFSIRLRGCNTFTEKFHGGSVNDAMRLAAARYPEAQNIHWLGETQTDENESHYASFSAEVKRRTDETNERVFGQQNDTTVHNDGGYDTNTNKTSGSATDVGLLFGAGMAVAAVGVAVLTFPLIVGGLTATLAHKVAKSTFNPGTAVAVALSAATFTGGTYGGWIVQREYMPEVAQAQVEFVQNVGDAIQGK